MAIRRHDLTGLQFRSLTVERFHHSRRHATGARAYWEVLCSCGHRTIMRADIIRRSMSCGCSRGERHSSTDSKEYSAWKHMRQRCGDPTHRQFSAYGGRGIYVCDEWRSFGRFLSDIGPAPSADHQIDRIDNDGPYAPDNCRWSTRKEQLRNTRRNRKITFRGETACIADWAARLGVDWKTIAWRLERWPIERALTEPSQRD